MGVVSIEGRANGRQVDVSADHQALALAQIEGVTLVDGARVRADVDSANRLLTKATQDPSTTAYTRNLSVGSASAATLAEARAGRSALLVQNQTASAMALALGGATPGANDLQVPAGGTFAMPFSYGGVVKGILLTAGITGNVVVWEATVP